MTSTQMGNVFLLGPDSDIWIEDESDLIALKQRKDEDPLFAWISNKVLQRFHLLFGRYFKVIMFIIFLLRGEIKTTSCNR